MAVYKREYRCRKTRKAAWCYQFQLSKATYKESGFETAKEAQDAEDTKRRDLKFEGNRSVPVRKTSLREFVPIYLEHRLAIREEGVPGREKRRFSKILEALGDKSLTAINVADIHAFVAKRKNQDGLANRSINLELNALRCLFRYAVECGYAYLNPAAKVKNLKEPRQPEHWIPDEEELRRFVHEAQKTYAGKVLTAWLWFMAYTGARPREALFVEWQDINFDRGQIVIRPKPGNPLKGGFPRHVELHPELRPILLAWRQDWEHVFEIRAKRHPKEASPPHHWVFYNPHDQLERAESFLRSFSQARENAKLPLMTPYTMRHFFISYCVMSGIDFLTISKWVGQKSTRMIEQVYGHLTPGFRAMQMTRFNISGKLHESKMTGITTTPPAPIEASA
jgi:integrase